LNTSPNVPGNSVDVPNTSPTPAMGRRAEHVAHVPGDSEGVPKTLSDVPGGSEDVPNMSFAKEDH
uniref:Microtubule-associated protein Jupiter n=1 Tax=Heligmosomoides polygyrus TaxID=6339 RepID=A0A183FAM6_HELPZ